MGGAYLCHALLVLMGALMEDKGDGAVPGRLQHLVPQSLLVRAVVPLGEVTGAVGSFRRRPDLSAVDAAAAVKPANRKKVR